MKVTLQKDDILLDVTRTQLEMKLESERSQRHQLDEALQQLIPSSIEGDSFRGFPNGKKSESMRRTDTEVRYGQSGCVTGRF